jgi:hypothetical protein
MILWIRILTTVLFSIFASILLFNIENRSNAPSSIVIPSIVALLTKYTLGDWDEGFRWTIVDIPYWFSIIGSSYGVVYILSHRDSMFTM